MMNLYEIIGLTKTTITGHSYETNFKNYILTDENGRGICKTHPFNSYVIYVALEKSYYSIHLSKYHCASFSGKLCYVGMMKISHANYSDFHSTITHFPKRPLFVSANFEVKEYDYEDFMDVYLHSEPDTFVFNFSSIGGNERDPWGYVYVNMDLFEDSINISGLENDNRCKL